MTLTNKITNPKKQLNSKWTAITSSNKEKHFMVIKLILPEALNQVVEYIELEAVHSKRKQLLLCQQLSDASVWLQGWL